MDNNSNKIRNKIFDRRLTVLVLIAFLIFIWILAVKYVSVFTKTGINENWSEISKEKTEHHKETILNLFSLYQNDVNSLSEKIVTSPDFQKQISRSDSKKLFEELLKLKIDNNYQVEIYNTRLEVLAFKGRKLDSDIFSMQKCLNKHKFSVIKEIGFYTFLVIYSPVFDTKDNSQVTGIVLTSRLIDIKYQINNKFFQNVGLLNDIKNTADVNAEIIPANIISGNIEVDSAALSGNKTVDLKGIDGSNIGVLTFQEYSKITHFHNIEVLTNKIQSLLVFGLTVAVFLIFLKFMLKINSAFLKFILFTIVLVVIRYVWIEFHFPSKTINLEIFSPGYYANTFGNGVAKSLGELFISSFFVLIISLYGLKLAARSKDFFITSGKFIPAIFGMAYKVILFLITFVLLYCFGAVIQSIIFDSNIKFFDRASIVPGVGLFIIDLIILILTFSLFLLMTGFYILILRRQFRGINERKGIKKFKFILSVAVPLAIYYFFAEKFNEFNLDSLSIFLILILSFIFAAYVCFKYDTDGNYKLFSLKNLSIVMLFCIITIPGILLEKITTLETNFVELIGKKISEKEDDKIKFLLLTELSGLSDSKKLESNFKNKNKLSELAFSVWADSKFSEENFNTAVIILDTNKKIQSDFIFNSNVLNPDSVLNYAAANYFKNKKTIIPPADSLITEDSLMTEDTSEEEEESAEEITEEPDTTDANSFFLTDNIAILDNMEEKYYLGIVPIEIVDLKNTQFARIIGYLLVAVVYESKNFLVQSSMQLFKNYSKDNLYDKLISNPVITEYVNDEIVSSTNQDLSKSNKQSLDAFRESIKYKNEKTNWRYEIINNEKYRTFYVLASIENGTGNQKIYSISLKRNDFKLTAYFYLKFILFVVFIYLFIFILISILLVVKIRKINLNFREKLFASFFIVSVIPIILLAIYTRSFIKNKYDVNFQNQIISDLILVSQTLKSNQLNINNIDTLSKGRNVILGKSLSGTDRNFNLFIKTRLVSTTNEELYKSDLLDTRIDADAYYNIIFLRKDFFSKTEEIGMFSFIVGYKPYYDINNNLAGVMSSQTLYRQNEINEELTEILTFIFGSYIIVIIILLVFVTFLTDRISKPILRLQYATEKISLGESIIELDVKRKDEIGNLIESFNKMTKELESSKIKLKKAEREAAWRDIARRVAHEIKNPLTPMKLSIQHLYDVYFNGKNNFPETLNKTRNMIINEIDKLNKIATEFSDFAKLSGRNHDETDLNVVIEEVISLYKLAPEIDFKVNLDKSISMIWADKQELNRVFQNLIKNSIQAIETKGIIEVETYAKGEFVYAVVTDNGEGIDEKLINNLFEPNFSTKSFGMGLGLSIVKKSLDDMNAEIVFESIINSGTKVTIKFIPINSSVKDGKH